MFFREFATRAGLAGAGRPARRLAGLVALVSAALVCALLGAPAAALAAGGPVIEGVSVSGVSSTDATLEASIDPGAAGVSTLYQFQVVSSPSEFAPSFVCPNAEVRSSLCLGLPTPEEGVEALPFGIVKGEGAQTVRFDIDSRVKENPGPGEAPFAFTPETTYHFRVIAATSALTVDTTRWEEPIVIGPEQTFTTAPAATTPPSELLAPVIEGVSVANVTETSATLEAKIVPGGSPTTYALFVGTGCRKLPIGACEASLGTRVGEGLLAAGSEPQTVTATARGLPPGETEEFHVVASNSEGQATGVTTFTTSGEPIPTPTPIDPTPILIGPTPAPLEPLPTPTPTAPTQSPPVGDEVVTSPTLIPAQLPAPAGLEQPPIVSAPTSASPSKTELPHKIHKAEKPRKRKRVAKHHKRARKKHERRRSDAGRRSSRDVRSIHRAQHQDLSRR